MLPLVWAAIIGVAVAMYVVLDGFDLGTFRFVGAGNLDQLRLGGRDARGEHPPSGTTIYHGHHVLRPRRVELVIL